MSAERLQKLLAAAGLGSRRKCEELILAGRVEVDRNVVTELGTRVDRQTQEIRVDGVVLPRPKLVYYALHKPQGIVSTSRDPSGRARVIDLVPDAQRLFSVGRLDMSSEGLILLTNDGELANRLTHPRYGVPKTYLAEVLGVPGPDDLKQLRQGIHLAEGFAKAAAASIKRRIKGGSTIEIVLTEGRNREVRRLLAKLGHKVLRLRRTAIGPLRLEDMPPGAHRRLHPSEVKALYAATRPPQAPPRKKPRRGRGK